MFLTGLENPVEPGATPLLRRLSNWRRALAGFIIMKIIEMWGEVKTKKIPH
jgi:hypothetical protein